MVHNIINMGALGIIKTKMVVMLKQHFAASALSEGIFATSFPSFYETALPD